MRSALFLLILLSSSASAEAQIIRSRFPARSEPNAWFSIGAGLQDGWTVPDRTSGWVFGSSTDFSASIEKPIGPQASIGITGTTSLVPVSFATGSDILIPDQTANVSRLFATLHLAPGGQFHTVLEAKAGATFYSFDRNAPSNADTDFTFALGYGFGYNFTPRFSIDIVQDQTTSVHQRDGLPASADANSRVTTTRLLGRLGIGG